MYYLLNLCVARWSRSFVGPVLGGMVFTALPEVLRAIADTSGLPSALAQFLRDGRLIIFRY